MRLRRTLVLLFALAMAALGASATSASAAIEILDRGIQPTPPIVGQRATLTVDVTVGQAPFIAEFQCCNVFTNNSTPQQSLVLDETNPLTQSVGPTRLTFTFDPGAVNNPDRIITVRIADSTGALKTLDIPFQSAITPPPPRPEPPRILDDSGVPGAEPTGVCVKAVELDSVVKVQTQGGGCWEQRQQLARAGAYGGVAVQPSETFYETTDRFTLNGIPFPAAPAGSRYVLVQRRGKGPLLGINRSITVRLGPLTIINRPILFELPFGTSVGGGRIEGVLPAFGIPAGVLGGLPVGGSVTPVLRREGSRYSARFPVQVTLPAVITPSPGTIGSVTGTTEITTDETRGVSLDGGKIEVQNVAIRKLGIERLCFSYLSAGVSSAFAACEPPSLNGAPVFSCRPPGRSQERFDGSLVIVLPTSSQTKLGAYAGVFGGQFSYAGAFIDNAAIPIVQGIELQRFGFGVCVNPLILRGDGGLSLGRGAIRGDVSVLYQETTPGFFVEAQGFLSLGIPNTNESIPVGNGRVKVFSTGRVEAGLAAKINVGGGFLTVEGAVNGIIVPRPVFRYQVDGSVNACIGSGFICAGAQGVVSNVGISGCGRLGRISYSGFFRFRDKFQEHGFGCGFADRARIFPRAGTARENAVGTVTFPVERGERQYVAHVKGEGAPPKIRVTSPSGRVFESGPNPGTTDGSTFIIVENPQSNETSIFLAEDAAPGDWKVEALPGSAPLSGEASFQDTQERPTVVAGTVGTERGKRVANLRYGLAPGQTVTLDVIGNGYQQTIAERLTGTPCPRGVTAPGRTAATSRCATVRFTPTFGYAGARRLQATVLDAEGAVVDIIQVARFTAPSPAVPTLPPDIRVVRRGTDVITVWGRSTGNVQRYGAYAVLSDGRRLGFTGPESCLAWRISNVARTTRVQFRVQAGRQDLAFGRAGQVTLASRAAYAGPRALRTARVPRACESTITP
ncbi:MAG: hypothetical protein MUE51_12925 [Thermoleophilia bacterium]|nr:hypothetical protein [Thermoleophilia bacterium]